MHPDLPRLAYLHIPKTAGTAFRHSLIEGLGRDRIFNIGDDCKADEWESGAVTAESLKGRLVVSGHTQADRFDALGIPFARATLVRDPVARCASFYNFTLNRHAGKPLWKRIEGKSLAEAADEPAFAERVRNEQCRRIAGIESAEAAFDVLRRGDWMVYFHEEVDQLIERVARLMDWPLPPSRPANVGRAGYEKRVLTDEARDALSALNREDIALIEMIRAAR